MADDTLTQFVQQVTPKGQKDLSSPALSQAQAPGGAPYSDAESAIMSGEYTFPKEKSVNVVDGKGQSFALPGNEVGEALKQGYRIETAAQEAKRAFLKDFKGLKGDAVVGFGQFADEFLGGIPEIVADKTASPDLFDKKEALKADHDLANTIGGMGGFAASAFYGGPLAKLFGVAGKGGEQAAKAIAKSLAERGLSKTSANLGARITAKTLENAGKLGVEGVISAAPVALTETALGDPGAGAETLLMGGGLGAGLGVLGGLSGEIFSSANKKAAEFMQKRLGMKADEASTPFMDGKTRVAPDPMNAGDGTLVGAAAADGAPESVLSKIKDFLGKKKSNADEITKSADALGLPVLEEQVADSKVVQDFASALSQKATIPGIARAQEYQKRFDVYSNILKDALKVGDDVASSKFAVGEKAKTDIMSMAKEAVDKEGAVFNELRQSYADIPLDKKPTNSVARNIENLSKSSLDDSARSLAKNIAQQFKEGRINTLDDLKSLRTQVNKAFSPTSSGELKSMVRDISERLAAQEELTIDRAIKARIQAASIPGSATLDDAVRLQGLYDDMQVANKNWAELSRNLEDAGDALGLGSVKSPSDFIRKMDNLTAEQIAGKLLPKNDVASLKVLKEKYPAQFEAVASLERAKLVDATMSDGKINPRKFFTQYKKMTPEFADQLFTPEMKQALNNVRVDLESLPININPSGTAKTLSYMNLLSKDNLLNPSFYLDNIADYATNAGLKKFVNIEPLIQTQKGISNIAKKLDGIPEAVMSMSKGFKKITEPVSSVEVINGLNRLVGADSSDNRKSYDSLRERMAAITSNPEILADNISKNIDGFSQSAPKIADAFTQKAVAAINYLQEAMPKPLTPENPFFPSKFTPSDADIAKFERKAAVVLDPFVVIDALKQGSLTQDHVEALAANYPLLYDSIRNKVMNKLIEEKPNLPYQARLKVSLLLGSNADPSLDPQSIMSLQNSFAFGDLLDENGDGLSQTGLNKMEPAKMNVTGPQKALMPKE